MQCEDIIRDFMEYIQQVDYNKYYETVTAVVPGDKAQQYVDFSLKSLKAAEVRQIRECRRAISPCTIQAPPRTKYGPHIVNSAAEGA